MRPQLRLIKPIRNFQVNGIQINIKLTGERLKLNSMIFAKLMRSFQTRIEDLIMMKWLIDHTQTMMLIGHSKDFSNNMEWRTKTKRSSSTNTTLIEREITTKFLVSQEMPLMMRSKRLIENLPFNIILKTILEKRNKFEGILMKWIRLLMHFLPSQEDTIMIFSILVKLHPLGPIISLKISGEIDSIN